MGFRGGDAARVFLESGGTKSRPLPIGGVFKGFLNFCTLKTKEMIHTSVMLNRIATAR